MTAPVRWTKRALDLLGTVPDRVIAERLGCSASVVCLKRQEQGIAPGGFQGRPPVAWTPEMDARLGTAPDRVLAEEWGLSFATVFGRRRSLGVPAGRRWAEPRVPFTPEMDELLGSLPDNVLAAEWGTTGATVGKRRKQLGVPAYSGPDRRGRPKSRLADPAVRADLAALTAREFAAKYKVSKQRAAQLRDAAGLPRVPGRRRKRPGDMFGTATILGTTPDASAYRLRCKCGREFEKARLGGTTATCGECPRGLHHDRADITGPVPGSRLTATRRVSEDSNTFWYFDCACGTKDFVARRSNVKQGLTRSCGCLRQERWEEIRRHGVRGKPREAA
jgi:hypothetical protein